jgi:hypothetical protein
MLKRNGSLPRNSGRALGRSQTSVLLLLAAIASFGLVKTSNAQAIPVAERTGRFDIFGAYNLTSPDYGQTKNKEGFSAGGAYLLRNFAFGRPALAVRYSYSTGATVRETFIGGGLESHYRFGPVNPYLTALYGVGGLAVPITGYSDSGGTFLIGGGADVPINRRFAVRGEFLYGFLRISGYHGTSVGAIDLTPATLNIGVVYHID